MSHIPGRATPTGVLRAAIGIPVVLATMAADAVRRPSGKRGRSDHDVGPATQGVDPSSGKPADLDIDPTPLTLETFFHSPRYLQPDAAREALEQRGARVERQPFAASEAMIVAAEARLGFRLPETLRRLYRRMNGGYIGRVHVALKTDPRLGHAAWRGAFAVDFATLAGVHELRTIAQRCKELRHAPEEAPPGADKLVILQVRHGDMTLLDYSRGAEPRVLIVDYDKPRGLDPIDVAFEDFDAFFAALRRQREPASVLASAVADFGPPLGDVPQSLRARFFWGRGRVHCFLENALRHQPGFEPAREASEALMAQTEKRLGVQLPPALRALWRIKNGGGVACRFVDAAPRGGSSHLEVMRFPVPLEYVVSLAELSDRIVFPPNEVPWKAQFPEPERLIVLEASHTRLLMLDYRGCTDNEPAVRVVDGLHSGAPQELLHAERFSDLVARLRPRLRGLEEVAQPFAATEAVAAQPAP